MSLILSKNKVSFETLMGVETPEATETFMPIAHHELVRHTRKAIADAGLDIIEEEHGLARGGLRYFGGFALTGRGIEGDERQVVLGLRNSHDRGFAAAVCIGNRMLVCDNLCFSSDVKLARRHTLHIKADLPRVLAEAVARVVSHWQDMTQRIEFYKNRQITTAEAGDLLVKLVDKKALPKSKLYDIIVEFRNHIEFIEGTTRHAEFVGCNLWNLYNAVTEHLKDSDHSKLPFRTMTMQSVFDPFAGHQPTIEAEEIVIEEEDIDPELEA